MRKQRIRQDEAHRNRQSDDGDPLRGRQNERRRDDDATLDGHGDRHENKRMFAVFERVERALDDQIRAGKWKADAQSGERRADEQRLTHADGRQQCEDDRQRKHDERRCEEAHDEIEITQGRAQILARLVDIAVRDGFRYFREDRSGDGHGDQRIRQHVDGVRILIRGVAGHVQLAHMQLFRSLERRAGGHAGDDDVDDLIDADDAEAPRGDRSHRTQSDAVNAEFRTVFQADSRQRNEQHQRLERHAKRPSAGGQRDFRRRPEVQRTFRGPAEHRDERAETDAADDVRADRAPRIRDEMVLRRENLPDHRIQAVEEDLGHAPQGEGGGEGHGFGAAVDIQFGQQRRGNGHEQRHTQQQGDGKGDEFVELGFGVLRFQRAHDLRHKHRVEDAAGNQCVDDLRNHRTGLVGVGGIAGGAQGPGKQDGADLAGHARSGGTGGHDQ